jgi:PAS domain S-box-containing protein
VEPITASNSLKTAYDLTTPMALLEQAPVGIAVFRGPSLEIDMVNPLLCRYWGEALEDILGKPLFVALPWAKEKGWEPIIESVYYSGVPFTATEVPVTNHKPELFAHVSFTPLRDASGRVTGVMQTALDITAQVQAFKKTEDTNRQMMKALQDNNLEWEQKYHDLQHANEELRKANQDLEQFAYITSHDLQEPLRKIRTFTGMAKKSLLKHPSSVFLEKIESSAGRMSSLIKAILDYARLSKKDEHWTRVDLENILLNVLGDYELLIHEKGAVVEYSGMTAVLGIPKQLEQLLANLIGNALKFSRDTPYIHITGGLPSPWEIASLQLPLEPASYVRICVEDNGIGFDQQHADKIFTLFQRLNAQDQFQGSGIGLAICKRIVDNHQGAITVRSQPGVGTRFTIYLPYCPK